MGNKELCKLIKTYQNSGREPITFDFKDAYNSLHNVNSNNVYYHYIHFYPGRIYPYIPRYLLSLPDFQTANGVLLDPFAGSGTILLESLINPFVQRECLGVEINPLGRLISKVKTTIFDTSLIWEDMKKLHKIYSKSANTEDLVPIYENMDIWFSKDATNKLAKLRYAIQNLETEKDIKDFFWVCFSNIIRKVSKADPYIPPPVILKLEKYRDTPKLDKLKEHLQVAESPNLWRIFKESVENNCKKLDLIFEILIKNLVEGKIIWDDARKIKKGVLKERGSIDKNNFMPLPTGSIDIIFTSPPYLTAQKYIRTSKLELLWLGYTIENINELDRQSVGTERISVSDNEIEKLGFSNIDKLIENTFRKSKARASVLYSYFDNMTKVIKEMNRILKNDGHLVLVVGDNKVLGKWIGTYRLLADIVVNEGFRELVMLKDRIKSRSMMTRRNGSGGLIKEEYVMIFQKR